MNENKLERVSALMDGELDSREREIAIENIEVDPETRGGWQRYHMIGDTMRNTLPSAVRPDLAAKLNEMLENEPTILAPKTNLRPKNSFLKNDYVKPLAGLAVAASVTAVAIFGLQSENQQKIPGLENETAVVVVNESEVLDSALVTQSSMVSVVPENVRTVKYEAVENTIEAKRLNFYILNHNQFNSRMGVQGVSPNARLVGHEAGQ